MFPLFNHFTQLFHWLRGCVGLWSLHRLSNSTAIATALSARVLGHPPGHVGSSGVLQIAFFFLWKTLPSGKLTT